MQFEKRGINKLFAIDAIEQVQRKWVAPIVFAPKGKRNTLICPAWQKPKVVNTRDACPILRMDGWIDLYEMHDSLVTDKLQCLLRTEGAYDDL